MDPRSAASSVKRHLDLFGYTIVRNLYKSEPLLSTYSALDTVHNGADCQAFTAEKHGIGADIVFSEQTAGILRLLLDDFWYVGSDSAYKHPNFGLHRDLAVRVPAYKLFIPLCSSQRDNSSIAQFLILPGSHHIYDYFGRNCAVSLTKWEGRQVIAACSSIDGSNVNNTSAPIANTGENLVRIDLRFGDCLLFNQNLVHGLLATSTPDNNSFLSASFYPAPATSITYGLERWHHELCLINQRIAQVEVDRERFPELSHDYTFREDIRALVERHPLFRNSLGFSRITQETYDRYKASYGHISHSIIFDGYCDYTI